MTMYTFVPLQKLIIELNYGEVIEVEYLAGSDTGMDVINRKYTPTTPRKGLIQHVNYNEIARITAFEVPPEEEKDTKVPPPLTNQILKIHEEKYNALQEISRNIMSTPAADIHAKTTHLLNSKIIGIAMLSTEGQQDGPLEMLATASATQTILYEAELFTSHRLYDKLKCILESENIIKVVHDPRRLINCMSHYYGIKVKNIFDTYETALKLTGNKMTLQWCLTHFLCIPQVLVDYVFSRVLKPQWNTRPLTLDLKYVAIKHVQFLITLKNTMEEELIKKSQAKIVKPSQNAVEQVAVDGLLSLEHLDINK